MARHYQALLTAICRRLEIPAFTVTLASELDRDPAFVALLAQARGRGVERNAYFEREAADIEYLRQHRRLGVKIGWARSHAQPRRAPLGTNELAFDRHYLTTFPEGHATRFLYVGPGRTLDPARPFAPPYIEARGEHRILVRPDEQVAAKLARCPARYRDGVLRHYDVLLAGWQALAGPLAGHGPLDKLQTLVETLGAAAARLPGSSPPLR
jgi:hypothetical protein